MGVRPGWPVAVAVAVAAAVAGVVAIAQAGSQPTARTQITIWATPPAGDAYGGLAHGGYAPTTGAPITERREIDVGGDVRGAIEARISGVAATLDPASVQLRDLTDPAAQIADQRFLPAAATPTEILARHVGESVTATTPRGDVAGVVRAVDDQVIAIETGAGDQRHLEVMRRDTYVQDLRLAAGATSDPTVAWRVRTARPGGKVRLFQRRAGRLEVVSEEPLRAGLQLQEYRVRVAGGGKQGVADTAVYAW